MRVSFLEIYNEELIDLLGAESVENPRLKIYEDVSKKACIESFIFSSADPKVSSAELMVLLICPSSFVRPSTFALNRYSSYSSYSIILNFLLEKLGI